MVSTTIRTPIAAAALAALAATGAIAGEPNPKPGVVVKTVPTDKRAGADGKSSSWTRVRQLPLGSSMAARPGSSLGWIEIQGWDWEMEEKPVSVFKGETIGIEPGYDSKKAKLGGTVGANESVTVGSGRTESPPEKDPLPGYLWGFKVDSTSASPAPPDKFGRVKVKFAWDGCAQGTRLPSLELRDARTLYRLEDVTIAGCDNDSATFHYARLRKSPASSPAR